MFAQKTSWFESKRMQPDSLRVCAPVDFSRQVATNYCNWQDTQPPHSEHFGPFFRRQCWQIEGTE